jgi:hypothetical protein
LFEHYRKKRRTTTLSDDTSSFHHDDRARPQELLRGSASFSSLGERRVSVIRTGIVEQEKIETRLKSKGMMMKE